MGDILTLGIALGVAMGAFLGAVYRNDKKASNLETATFGLVDRTETTIVDNELLTLFRSLPSNVTSLSREQRAQMNDIVNVYSHLELLDKEVLSIGGHIASSLILGVLAAISTPIAAFLYESSNSLSILGLFLAFALASGYIYYGVYPARRIRNVELANRGLLQASTISELDRIAIGVLESQFGHRITRSS